jgi:hypothetical protein
MKTKKNNLKSVKSALILKKRKQENNTAVIGTSSSISLI